MCVYFFQARFPSTILLVQVSQINIVDSKSHEGNVCILRFEWAEETAVVERLHALKYDIKSRAINGTSHHNLPAWGMTPLLQASNDFQRKLPVYNLLAQK